MSDLLARLDDYAATGELPEVEWVLHAAPHKRGLGKIHIWLYDDERTQCGMDLAACPGTAEPGTLDDVTCKRCAYSRETPQRWEDRRREWRENYEQHWREIALNALEEERRWRDNYERHLESPEWQRTRSRVFARARGRCELCGMRPATQVHHLTYERVGRELLIDLAAICRPCHEEIHGR